MNYQKGSRGAVESYRKTWNQQKTSNAHCLKFAEQHLDTPVKYWEDIVWWDQNWTLWMPYCTHVWKALHITPKTLNQQWSLEVGASGCGAVQLPALKRLTELKEGWKHLQRQNKNCCHLSGWWRWNWRLKPLSWFHRRKIKHGPANQLTRKNQVITNKGFCICIKYTSVTMFNVFPVSFMVWLDGLFLTSGVNSMSQHL